MLQTPTFWQARQAKCIYCRVLLGGSIGITMDMEYKYIRDLGRIFNRNMEAERLIQEMQQSVALHGSPNGSREATKALFIEVQGKHFRLYGHKTLAGNIGASFARRCDRYGNAVH